MKTLSLYEDNAGGLHLLRHADNLVVSGLQLSYSVGTEEGTLGTAEAAEYFLDSSVDSLEADGWETAVEPDGEDAERFDRDFETPNGIKLVAEYHGWTLHHDEMGSNARCAFGLAD